MRRIALSCEPASLTVQNSSFHLCPCAASIRRAHHPSRRRSSRPNMHRPVGLAERNSTRMRSCSNSLTAPSALPSANAWDRGACCRAGSRRGRGWRRSRVRRSQTSQDRLRARSSVPPRGQRRGRASPSRRRRRHHRCVSSVVTELGTRWTFQRDRRANRLPSRRSPTRRPTRRAAVRQREFRDGLVHGRDTHVITANVTVGRSRRDAERGGDRRAQRAHRLLPLAATILTIARKVINVEDQAALVLRQQAVGLLAPDPGRRSRTAPCPGSGVLAETLDHGSERFGCPAQSEEKPTHV